MDATLQFLARLNDRSNWEVDEAVPIFRQHVRRDPKTGEFLYEVKDSDLPEIAANMAQLERTAGVVGRITGGHIKPQLPEDHQPEVLGFMKNPRAGVFGPNRIPCVLVDRYFYKHKSRQAKAYPYRSAEYYPGSKVIRGLALLTRDPALDLGVTGETYAAEGPCYHYAESNMGNTNTDTMVKPGNPPEVEEGKPTPEEESQMDGYMKKYRKYCMQRYNFVDKPDGTQKPDEMVRMQRDSLMVSYEQLKASHNDTLTRLANLERERDAAVCERMVSQLEAEGYQLERAEEVAELMARPAATRESYLARVRKNYTKAPVVPVAVQYQAEPPAGMANNDVQLYQAAMDVLRANPGMTLEQAYAKIQAK